SPFTKQHHRGYYVLEVQERVVAICRQCHHTIRGTTTIPSVAIRMTWCACKLAHAMPDPLFRTQALAAGVNVAASPTQKVPKRMISRRNRSSNPISPEQCWRART